MVPRLFVLDSHRSRIFKHDDVMMNYLLMSRMIFHFCRLLKVDLSSDCWHGLWKGYRTLKFLQHPCECACAIVRVAVNVGAPSPL